ncbi:hypothetical protein SADUNF_Sadunf10G0025700 [Salix dunnii]|uniref:Uncharacterized protein n=1 Tax=Salix dunnii TaxID=1413687 RepID=A0A835JUS8_9ROSI|nr:hypothetical protein SADUNF_Sadunf10G0025700 [Salix dunnii]
MRFEIWVPEKLCCLDKEISVSGLDARHFPAKFASYLQHISEKGHDQIQINTAENNCGGSYKLKDLRMETLATTLSHFHLWCHLPEL